MVYNMVDLYWVGRISSDAVAAVGSAVFFIQLGMAIFSIVSIGTLIKVSHAYGANNSELKQKYISAAALIGMILSALCAFVLMVFPHQLIALLGIESEIVSATAASFLRITSLGVIVSYTNIWLSDILNSHGLPKLSFRAVLCGNIVNMVLDPIFIFALDLGVDGAAWATIVSWCVTFAYLFIIVRKRNLISINFSNINTNIYTTLLKVGGAGATQRILFSLIAIVIGKIIASFGSEAIAAQKIGLQVEGLTYMMVHGVAHALSIATGHAYGAKQILDIKRYYKTAIIIGAVIAICSTALFLIYPSQLISIFVDNPNTIQIGASYLLIIGISQIFMTAEMITGGAFNGQGLTQYSATISIIFTSLRIPLALYLCSTELGILGVWWSISITSIIKGCVSVVIYQIEYRKLLKLHL